MVSHFSARSFRIAQCRQSTLPSNLVSQRRAFHATQRNQIFHTCLDFTHNTLLGLHSFTGLTWASTIPLVALTLRVSLIHPFIHYSNKMKQRQISLEPILHTWAKIIHRKAILEHGESGLEAINRVAKRAIKLKRREIYKRQNIKIWKHFLSFVQVPVFLMVSETLRRMSGMSMGLVGWMAGRSSFEPTPEDVMEHSVDEKLSDHGAIPLEPSVNEELSDHGVIPLEPSVDEELMEHPVGLLESSVNDNQVDSSMDLFEPSLAYEGALWFPNLLLPDPTLTLPFILSASMIANVSYQKRLIPNPSKWQTRFFNAFKLMALAAAPLTLQVPTALLIYWISSSLFGLAHFVFMQWYQPRIPHFKPCKSRDKRVLLGGHPAKQQGI